MKALPLTFQKWFLVNLLLFLGLVFSIFVFSFAGRPFLFPTILLNPEDPYFDILTKVRLPRVILAACVGANLSSSGLAFQALLRNPLADPYILGVSGGAALGGVVMLVMGLPFQIVLGGSFLAGMASLFLIYWIARVDGRLPVHTLLLTGVIFNAFAFALVLLINSLVSLGQAHQILYLLMGSLEAHQPEMIFWMALVSMLGFIFLLANASRMNVVALGEESATQLGLDVEAYRRVLFFAASLMVGASVAVAGLIGFVGLFVPHILRLVLGSDHRLLIPASALGGGIFLILCDFLARTLFVGNDFLTQLPVGVITALIGGPFFVYLLKKR